VAVWGQRGSRSGGSGENGGSRLGGEGAGGGESVVGLLFPDRPPPRQKRHLSHLHRDELFLNDLDADDGFDAIRSADSKTPARSVF